VFARRFTDVSAFADLALPLVLANEAENCLLAGILTGLRSAPRTDAALVLVEDEAQEPRSVVVRTPPFLFTSSALPAGGAEAAIDCLLREGIEFPGVLGRTDTAEALCSAMTLRTGITFVVERREGVHELVEVNDVPIPAGVRRIATAHDLAAVTPLVKGFVDYTATRRDGASPEDAARRFVDAGTLHVWDDEGVVAIAVLLHGSPNGRGVSFVFTPEGLRGRGYATALVADVSRFALRSGKRFCFLFTDLANPTSNAIYRRIGYRKVADFTALAAVRP
jgi:uncharacterized protein